MANINVYGTINTMASDNKVVVASQVYDEAQQKFQDQINQETDNDGLVSAKVVQSFTDAQKVQARANIGAGDLQSVTQEQFNAIFE